MSEPDGFLGRWARRKQAAQRSLPADNGLQPADSAPATLPIEPASDLPLPSLADIVPGADVTAFMQAHVPEALRRAALRKLWVTDPHISSFIEMADYQWDFNNPDAIPGWGSSVAGPDAKRLLARFLGDDDVKIDSAVAKPSAVGSSSQPAPAVEMPANDPPAEPPEALTPPPAPTLLAADETPPPLEESLPLPAPRARHGRALPT